MTSALHGYIYLDTALDSGGARHDCPCVEAGRLSSKAGCTQPFEDQGDGALRHPRQQIHGESRGVEATSGYRSVSHHRGHGSTMAGTSSALRQGKEKAATASGNHVKPVKALNKVNTAADSGSSLLG
jgi:hypothetical protein